MTAPASERDRILARIDALIEDGVGVAKTVDNFYVALGQFQGWRAKSMSFLSRTLSKDDVYLTTFETETRDPHIQRLTAGVEILRAVREDVEGGYLIKFAELVSASIFTDLLDMADELLRNGYKDPAASLAGAVLEDGLRRAATKAGMTPDRGDGLDSLNRALADAEVYNAFTRSRVDSWRILRNAADHGNFAEYTQDDVSGMVAGVRDVLGDLTG